MKKREDGKMKKITNYKIQISNPKGGHGLPKDTPRLQTMTVFNQKFLRGGPGGAVFSKSAPLAAGGN